MSVMIYVKSILTAVYVCNIVDKFLRRRRRRVSSKRMNSSSEVEVWK